MTPTKDNKNESKRKQGKKCVCILSGSPEHTSILGLLALIERPHPAGQTGKLEAHICSVLIMTQTEADMTSDDKLTVGRASLQVQDDSPNFQFVLKSMCVSESELMYTENNSDIEFVEGPVVKDILKDNSPDVQFVAEPFKPHVVLLKYSLRSSGN